MSDLDTTAFTKAFIEALSNEKVIKVLEECVSSGLKHDISVINTNVDRLLTEIQILKTTCNELKNENELLKTALNKRDSTIADMNKKVKGLEDTIDKYDQQSKSNNLRVIGLEEKLHENTEAEVMKLLTGNLKLELDKSDIEQVYRVGKPNESCKSRPVVIKFTSYRVRDMVFRKRGNLKTTARNTYINEDLTKKRSQQFQLARQMKRNGKINDCWTWDGTVLIKDLLNKVHKVNQINDFEKF